MDADANGVSLPVLEQILRLVAEFLGEEFVDLVAVRGGDGVEQRAELPGERLAEGAGAGRDDLAELDVVGGPGRRTAGDLLDDLGLPRSPGGQLGEHTGAGAGELPAGGPEADRLERQRNRSSLATSRCLVELILVVCQNRAFRAFRIRVRPRRRRTPLILFAEITLLTTR